MSITKSDEYWKEQLGFISGTTLVWGTLLFGLWPAVAGFHSGLNAHVWTLIPLSQNPAPGFALYQGLTAILALGVCTVVLSIIHILSRGLWLGIPEGKDQNTLLGRVLRVLERLAFKSYIAVFIQWLFTLLAIFSSVLILLGAGIEFSLRNYSSPASVWPRLLVGSVLAAAVMLSLFIAIRILKKQSKINNELDDSSSGEPPSDPTGKEKLSFHISIKDFVVSFLFFGLIWGVTIEMCYTASLKTDKRMVIRSKAEYVEAVVFLGGATSDPNLLRLELRNMTTGDSRLLETLPLEEGQYVAYINSGDLTEGPYQVRFTYPHTSLSSSYPHLSNTVEHYCPLMVNP